MPKTDTNKGKGGAALNFDLSAFLDASGALQLRGEGLLDNVIEVPTGESAIVTITDATGLRLYAMEVPQDGGASSCWQRDTTQGQIQLRFDGVSSDRLNAVLASEGEAGAAHKIKYGPVITVKPKG